MTDPASAPARVPLRRVLAAFLLPAFFVIVFPLAYVSATHAPSPHDLALAVVGPDQVVGRIASSLDRTAQFDVVEQTDQTSRARSVVADRDADGSILVAVAGPEASGSAESAGAASGAQAPSAQQPALTVTAYVAEAGGRAAASSVEAAASGVAKQLGTTARTVDVAPLTTADPLGTDLFYLLVYTSLGGYLVIIVLTQVMPSARLRVRFGVALAASIAAPALVFGLSSIFVGDYAQDFGTIVSLLGVDALYVFTVSSVAILLQQFLRGAATFGVMAFIVFLNFPSAGGAVPAALLPRFWQGVHSFYFGAGAFESFRSLVYFDGAGLERWLPQLMAWTAGLLLAIVLVETVRVVRRQRLELARLEGERTSALDALAASAPWAHKALESAPTAAVQTVPTPEASTR